MPPFPWLGTMLNVLQATGPKRSLPPYLATASAVEYGDGFYLEENDRSGSFRWMAEAGELRFEAADRPRFLELVFYCEFHDLSQWLEAECAGRNERLELGFGWTSV